MKVKALSPALGAEVTGIDLSVPLDAAIIDDLGAIWLEHQMIVIRGQDLTPAQQLAFAKALGEPDIYPFLTGLDGFPMITEVLKKEDEKVNFGGVWHSDTTYQKCPPMATLLYAKELPPLAAHAQMMRFVSVFAAQRMCGCEAGSGVVQFLTRYLMAR